VQAVRHPIFRQSRSGRETLQLAAYEKRGRVVRRKHPAAGDGQLVELRHGRRYRRRDGGRHGGREWDRDDSRRPALQPARHGHVGAPLRRPVTIELEPSEPNLTREPPTITAGTPVQWQRLDTITPWWP